MPAGWAIVCPVSHDNNVTNLLANRKAVSLHRFNYPILYGIFGRLLPLQFHFNPIEWSYRLNIDRIRVIVAHFLHFKVNAHRKYTHKHSQTHTGWMRICEMWCIPEAQLQSHPHTKWINDSALRKADYRWSKLDSGRFRNNLSYATVFRRIVTKWMKQLGRPWHACCALFSTLGILLPMARSCANDTKSQLNTIEHNGHKYVWPISREWPTEKSYELKKMWCARTCALTRIQDSVFAVSWSWSISIWTVPYGQHYTNKHNFYSST